MPYRWPCRRESRNSGKAGRPSRQGAQHQPARRFRAGWVRSCHGPTMAAAHSKVSRGIGRQAGRGHVRDKKEIEPTTRRPMRYLIDSDLVVDFLKGPQAVVSFIYGDRDFLSTI